MIVGRDRPYHVDPWPPENGVVGDGTFRILNSVMTLNGSTRTENSTMLGKRASFTSNLWRSDWVWGLIILRASSGVSSFDLGRGRKGC